MRTAVLGWAELPEGALGLFGGDFFSTLAWYGTVQQGALPPGASAAFVLVEDAGAIAAVLPMQRLGAALSSLTTPYTCLWRPLLAQGVDTCAVGEQVAAFCRGWPVRLDALDLEAPAWKGLRSGLRRGAARGLSFDHFGNWIFPRAQAGWEAYLAGRPGSLRESIRRRTKKLLAAGADFRVVDSSLGLEEGIDAYTDMHARSWKAAEPFPDFNALLMRRCAAEGTLRLGCLSLEGRILAAQFWVVFGHVGMVLKLAHDAAADAWSPGTVLAGLMIRHLLGNDEVDLLDFGRGDDAYKRLWMSERRQRSGLLLASPYHPAGAYEIMRGALGNALKPLRRRARTDAVD